MLFINAIPCIIESEPELVFRPPDFLPCPCPPVPYYWPMLLLIVSQKVIILWTFLETSPHDLWQVHLENIKAQQFYLVSLNIMLGTLVSFQNQLAYNSPYIFFLLGDIQSRRRFTSDFFSSLPFYLLIMPTTVFNSRVLTSLQYCTDIIYFIFPTSQGLVAITPIFIYFYFFNIYLFVCLFWLRHILVATSLFVFLVSFGYVGSLLLHAGFLQLRRVTDTLCCGARASHCSGLSCCGAQAVGMQASVVVAHGLSSYGAQAQLLRSMWDLPDQGWNPCPLHWQVDS